MADWGGVVESLGSSIQDIFGAISQTKANKKLFDLYTQAQNQPGFSQADWLNSLSSQPGYIREQGMQYSNQFPSQFDMGNLDLKRKAQEIRARELGLREAGLSSDIQAKQKKTLRQKQADYNSIATRVKDSVLADVMGNAPANADRATLRTYYNEALKKHNSSLNPTIAEEMAALGYDPDDKDVLRISKAAIASAGTKLYSNNAGELSQVLQEIARENATNKESIRSSIADVKSNREIENHVRGFQDNLRSMYEIKDIYDLSTNTPNMESPIDVQDRHFDPMAIDARRGAFSDYEKWGSKVSRNISDLAAARDIQIKNRNGANATLDIENELPEVRAVAPVILPYVKSKLESNTNISSYQRLRDKAIGQGGGKVTKREAISRAKGSLGGADIEKDIDSVVAGVLPGIRIEIRRVIVQDLLELL